jgi:hypothetical protein
VYIPASVTEIGHHAFWDCCYKEGSDIKGINVMNVGHSSAQFGALTVGDDWLPEYDHMLFKKPVEVKYSQTRAAMPK